MPFTEKALPPPPVNVVEQAIMVHTYMRNNPNATPFSAAPKLNINRKRIARLLTIAEKLPPNLITELADCNDPKTLRQMNVKYLLYIANLSSQNEQLQKFNRNKIIPKVNTSKPNPSFLTTASH